MHRHANEDTVQLRATRYQASCTPTLEYQYNKLKTRESKDGQGITITLYFYTQGAFLLQQLLEKDHFLTSNNLSGSCIKTNTPVTDQ